MNILLKNIKAVLRVNNKNIIEDTDICIEGNRIVAIGNIPDGFTAEKVIDGKDKLVIPGLINAHTHCYMTFMRNLADDVPFIEWLLKCIDPIEGAMTTEDTLWGTKLGIIEMMKTGTTCYNDMHIYKCDDVPTVIESGIRAVMCTGLVGFSYEDEAGQKRIDKTLKDMKDSEACDRITHMFGPHAPYSCSEEFFRKCSDIAKKYGIGIHTHLSESVVEEAQTAESYSKTPVEMARDNGLFDVPCVVAHCVQVSDSDMDILKEYNVSVASNPVSNMKLGNGFAPIPEMLAKGINVCLGTDGAASNNSLNMFHEMNVMSLIHKGTQRETTCVSAQEVFDMATINGAKALGLEKEIGSIEVGKKADLAILDLNSVTLQPHNNILSALVYSANGSEVETMIIDGQITMENRKLLTIDEKQVYEEVNKMIPRILEERDRIEDGK